MIIQHGICSATNEGRFVFHKEDLKLKAIENIKKIDMKLAPKLWDFLRQKFVDFFKHKCKCKYCTFDGIDTDKKFYFTLVTYEEAKLQALSVCHPKDVFNGKDGKKRAINRIKKFTFQCPSTIDKYGWIAEVEDW